MLKYKKHIFATIADTAEELTDILAGMSGKARRIVSVTATIQELVYIRIYRDAEQFVDYPCNLITDEAPIIPMDLPLAEGQLCKAGFYNNKGGAIANANLVIGYEEAG